MTLSVWQRTIVNTAGDVLGSASVTVRRESDNALATLYDNPAGTGSPLTNPLIADSVGFVRFYTANDRYNITATSGSFSATWRHVQLGTAQSVDADQDLQTTDAVEFAALTVDDVTIDANTISTATGEDLTLSPAGDLIVSSNVNVTGDLTLSGDVAFTGSLEVDNLRLDGSTISSTTTGDNLTLSPLSGVAEVDGDLLPGADGTYDLGSPSLEWQNLYIDGIASIDSLVADTADINGGTIDNTIIGGSVAAAGTFTSVDADYIDLATSTSPVPADAVGRLRWDQDEAGGTLMLGMSGGNVVQPVGEAQYYWVKASSAITKGQVIMASGVVGVSGKIEGAPATGLDKDTGIRVIGIAAENIANNEWGLVTSFGYVRGVNTNAFNANDVLYLDPSVAGGLTNSMPAAPNPKVIVALVVVKDTTNGELLVRVTHGQTFGALATDAQITSPSGNDFLVYDSGDNRWENYTAANARTAMGLGTIATQDANNVNIDGGSIDGTTIGASTRAAGNFTTLNANGNVILGDASTDTVTIAGPLTTTAGNVVINESGGDFDFRVESDTNTHALFVDASANVVNINSPSLTGGDLNVNDVIRVSGAAPEIKIDVGSGGYYFGLSEEYSGDRAIAHLKSVAGASFSGQFQFAANSAAGAFRELFRLDYTNGAVFNEGGADIDFRVESDTNTHALFVEGSSGNVGIGTSTTTGRMDIDTGDGVVCFRNYNSAIGAGTGSAFDFLDASRSSIVDGGIRATNLTLLGFGATPMIFATNNTERARIDSSGNLGIGTSSPGSLLDVAGGVQATGAVMRLTNSASSSSWVAGDVVGAVDFYSTDASFPGTKAQIKAFADTGNGTTAINYSALSFSTMSNGNFAECLRIDSSGNLGLGVTPSAWGSQRALEFAYGGLSIGGSLGVELVANTYWNGSNWIYRASASAQRYEQDSNGHKWYTAPSGIAGNTISFTQTMTLDASGNLLVGGTSPVLSAANRGNITITGSTSSIVSVGTSVSAYTYLYHDASGAEVWNNQNTYLRFGTNNTERMRIDSSGNVGIGTSSPSEKLEVNGNIKTAAPSGGTAAAWKLGTVATVSPTSPNRTIEVEINGTIYYLAAKTTND